MRIVFRKQVLSYSVAAALLVSSAAAWAQQKSFDIPAQEAVKAIPEFARQAGIQIIAPAGQLQGVRTPVVKGNLDVHDALKILLQGTDLDVASDDGAVITLRKRGATRPSRPANEGSASAVPAVESEQRVGAEGAKGQVTEFDEIVVTGSRIRRAEIEGPSPVIFLTREDLDRTGRSTVAEALAALPQNFAAPAQIGNALTIAAQVDLRGLGSDNTLVLVNGRRVAASGAGPTWFTPFTDLNSIPLSAVERIEILTDGASAVYGADAVAGVVNIILKKDYQGAEISVSHGDSTDGGASERRVNFTLGGNLGSVNGLLAGEYFKRDALAATDRDFSRSADQRARGGTDQRTTFSNPGNVSSLTGQNLPGVGAPSAGIPSGQDGRNLTPGDFAASAGQLNRQSLQSHFDLVAPSERRGVNGRLSWELSPELSLFAEGSVAHTTHRPSFYPPLFTLTVPASNPFNPFGQSVRVQWLATEFGERQAISKTRDYRSVVGAEGRLAESWAWQTSFEYSRNTFLQQNRTLLSTVVRGMVNRTDPATALNVFGDGAGANTPAVLQELAEKTTIQRINGASTLKSWEGHMDGVLADLAGRELRAAVGMEYRKEGLNHVDASLARTEGDRNVTAGFAELSYPLFGPEHQRSGFRALELQLAGRWDRYSDFGETSNPRLAIRWQPLESLALRASASTGFRAPALQELFGPVFENVGFPVVDPRRNNESVLVTVKGGANPSLTPEKSKNWNLGLVWDVPGLQGLSLTMDWYGLRQRDVITNVSDSFTFNLTREIEQQFPDRFLRADPTPADIAAGLPGQLIAIDASAINVSQITTRGMDFGLSLKKSTEIGRFDAQINGTYIDKLEAKPTPTAPIQSHVGKTGSGLSGIGSPVRFRGNASIFWSRGAWEVGVTERYTDNTREARSYLVAFGRLYDDHYETDLQVNYRWQDAESWLAGTRLSFSVKNLFNAEPPFADEALGYLGTLYDPRGRFISVTLTKAF